MDAASLAALEGFLLELESAGVVPESLPYDSLSEIALPPANPPATKSIDEIDELALKQSQREAQHLLAAQRRQRYANKVKSERAKLKQQEHELSAQLSRLQEARSKPEANMKTADYLALSAWKAVAMRQRERLLEAEEQRRKLKVVVAHQAKLIREMKDLLLLKPVPRSSVNEQAGAYSSAPFKTFAHELDALYAMTDQVCSQLKFKFSSAPLQFGLTREWNHAMTFLESADATTIPFDLELASNAMTSVMLRGSKVDCYEIDESEHSTNTAATKNCFDYSQELGDSAVVTMHTVVRRYVEADRVVFVWRALTEGQGDFEGLYTDETAWYVLRPSTKEVNSPMIVEAFTRLVPVGFELSGSDARGNRFVEILARADEEDVDDMTRTLECMLLGQANNNYP